MAQRHHKPDERVEGDPDTGHGRGVPRRPDETRLDERTREDRREAGPPVGKWEDTGTVYEEERAEADREAGQGRTKSGEPRRRDRGPYPPGDYEDRPSRR